MATSAKIKSFLASWLQLGKAIEYHGGENKFQPDRILSIDGYSQEFEDWWSEFKADSQHWFLAGSHHPLSELFEAEWDIESCSRCDMPIPLRVAGINDSNCPCADLITWPNLELPQPRAPKNTGQNLRKILSRFN